MASFEHHTAQHGWSENEERHTRGRIQEVIAAVKACLPPDFVNRVFGVGLDEEDVNSVVKMDCPRNVNMTEINRAIAPLGCTVSLEAHPADTEARHLSLSRPISYDRARLINKWICGAILCVLVLFAVCATVLYSRVGKYQNATAYVLRNVTDALGTARVMLDTIFFTSATGKHVPSGGRAGGQANK